MNAPRISRPVLSIFRRIVRGYFRRHFHGVRISRGDGFEALGGAISPLIIYANHGSWWDPMIAILLAERWMPSRRHFAPMDAEALQRYGILKYVGIFPVEINTRRGAVQFMRNGETILSGGGVLWVTPQGQFIDSRVRPLQFKPGMAELAARVAGKLGECNLLPLGIEYPFWDERLPECLVHVGEVVRVVAGASAEDIQVRAITALENAMDQVQSMAVRRDASLFQALAPGTAGAGGFYGWAQTMKSAVFRRASVFRHAATIGGVSRTAQIPAVRDRPAVREVEP
jgi:1-acyl-sn-glycerol-3-phosphate acyltransferase